ncbi:MAG TPA: DUF1684 domain-containing protein, partial [Flavobacteriaceae bacterium]|nr:DUF1684 domain-containing protein [Flavobacteriaceae bacterium]
MRYLLIVFVFWTSGGVLAQKIAALEESQQMQQELNAAYTNPETSVLMEDDFKNFEGLEFYPLSEEFIVEAKFVRTPDEKPFEMPTTTERLPKYVKFGELQFTLKGQALKLDVYQATDHEKHEGYEDYLFLPFTDMTNGDGSYGGGRYMDFRIPKGNKVILDFNQAYNPYCAYNPKYSCPIPPEGNDLPLRI